MKTLKKIDKVIWILLCITLGVFAISGALFPIVINTKWMYTAAVVNIGLMVFFMIVGTFTHIEIIETKRVKKLKTLYPNCF